jgi:hypothetical protein
MSAAPEAPVTYVEAQLRRRRRLLLPLLILLVLLLAVGLIAVGFALAAAERLTRNRTEAFPDIVAHFEHGSIGADQSSGIPFWVWKALPRLFPAEFDGHLDYRAFGFSTGPTTTGGRRTCPLGFPSATSTASISSGSIARFATPALSAPRKEAGASSCVACRRIT